MSGGGASLDASVAYSQPTCPTNRISPGALSSRAPLHRAGRQRGDRLLLVARLARVVDLLPGHVAVLVDHIGGAGREAEPVEVGAVLLGDRALRLEVREQVGGEVLLLSP